jgi:hypothetical protein
MVIWEDDLIQDLDMKTGDNGVERSSVPDPTKNQGALSSDPIWLTDRFRPGID